MKNFLDYRPESSEVNFYMLIGLPGSGKSYFIDNCMRLYDHTVVVSTDAIRAELFGSEEDQQNPDLVFSTARKRIKEALSNGHSVTFDATNINERRRTSFLKEVIPEGVKKIAIVMAIDPDLAFKQNLERDRTVPENVIHRMLKQFQFPKYREGWDEIRVYNRGVNSDETSDEAKALMHKYAEKLESHLAHDCPKWHSLDVTDHSFRVAKEASEKASERGLSDEKAIEAFKCGFYHDIGKPYCKEFAKPDGTPSDQANFIGHGDVGGLLLASCGRFRTPEWVCATYHMDLFKKELEEIVYKEVEEHFGKEARMYLELVHEADDCID